jgi:hypothetical protein
MSAFRGALTDLVITAIATRSDLEELYACSHAVLEELPTADSQEHVPALRRLADTLPMASLAASGVLALTGAAIVEAGGPPGVLLAPVMERLEEALETARKFVQVCEKAAPPGTTPAEAVTQLGESLAPSHPREALAWNALETLGLSLLALLGDAGCRERAGERAALRARLLPLREVHERVGQILECLPVLEA